MAALTISDLASAWLQFSALADELPDCPHRDALQFAAQIASALSNLRTDVQTVIGDLEQRDNFNTIDAARELRRALGDA